MATYDELYEKMYEEIKKKGINVEDCELEFGYNPVLRWNLR